MLNRNQLLKVIKLGQAVGQRRSGHFDHDASLATGPSQAQFSPGDQASRSAPNRAVVLEEHELPTGEIVYRRRGRTRR